MGGFTINGKGFPATAPVVAKLGQKLRIRYMNEGQLIHLDAPRTACRSWCSPKDGWNLPQPYMCDTLNVAPGERWDVLVDCTRARGLGLPLPYSLARRGRSCCMRMVTALIINDPAAAVPDQFVASTAGTGFVCKLG